MTKRKLGLSDAYAVESPEDNRALYRDWADSYETEFAVGHGWVCHLTVASLFADQVATEGIDAGPVLDVGCGTGVVGMALHDQSFMDIDGIDISPEMLAIARTKGCYGSLFEADVTHRLPIEDASYGGVVSAGTFTHGHLGPQPLPELVRIGRPSAVYAIGINTEHFVAHGFANALAELEQQKLITAPRLEDVPMYAGDGAGDHANDRATIAVFVRL